MENKPTVKKKGETEDMFDYYWNLHDNDVTDWY